MCALAVMFLLLHHLGGRPAWIEGDESTLTQALQQSTTQAAGKSQNGRPVGLVLRTPPCLSPCRYGGLKSLGEKKAAFNEYVQQRKKEEAEEARQKRLQVRPVASFAAVDTKRRARVGLECGLDSYA